MTSQPNLRISKFAAVLLCFVLAAAAPKVGWAADDGVTAPPTFGPYPSNYQTEMTQAGVGSVGSNANNGSPLRYWVDPYLRTWAYAQNYENDGVAFWREQYAGQYRTMLRVTDGQGSVVCGPHQTIDRHRFIASSGPTRTISNGNEVITTVVTTLDGDLRITHTVTYKTGEYRIRHDWKVENRTTNIYYGGIALRFGGSCKLGGVNASAGGWDETTRFLYCVRNDNGDSGRMGFQEISGAQFSGVVEGYSYDITDGLMIGSGDFPVFTPQTPGNFIGYSPSNSEFTPYNDPNGMAVEWRRSSLAPGASFQVYTYERWIPSGSIQVVAPSDRTATPGEQVTVDFRVSNLMSSDQQSVSLAAVPPTDWSTNSLESPQVIGISDYFVIPVSVSTFTVSVTVTVPSNVAAGTYYLSLEALGEIYNPQVSRARAVVLDGASSDRIAITIAGNPTAVVTAPTIPLSSGSRVIYTAISPSTSEGIDSVIAALSGRSTSVTRAFAWDSSTQAYVEVPRLRPTGDIQTYTGIFIATREPLRYSLSGTSTSAPFTLTLRHRGWTFAGIPPIYENQPTPITTFAWPYPSSETSSQQIQITYDSSLEITPNAYESMGTVSSEDNTTSRPWFWNGSAYVQVDELIAGRAYWFKNNLDTEITLTAGNGNVASRLLAATTSSTVTTASATVVAHDIGQPPAMPSGSESAAESSSGSKCGTGSGIAGFAFLSLVVAFGLRLRRNDRP